MQTELFSVSPDCEIVSTRIIKATRETVFNAWTNPNILKAWWGPAGFTNTFETFDLRVGGRWKFVMHGPDGVGNYNNECEFLVIEKPGLLAWQRISQPLFRVVTTFEETTDGYTHLVFRMQFEDKKLCDTIRKFAPEKNEENFDKLEAVLHL